MSFRCAADSLQRGDDPAGSASTFRAFVLVEFPRAWGTAVLRDSALPDPVKAHLRRAPARACLVRRPGRPRGDAGVRVFAAWTGPSGRWLETTVLDRVEDVCDIDFAPLRGGRSVGLTPTSEPVLCVCTHGKHDVCCAERGRPVATALAESHPEHTWEVSHIGGDRFAANLMVLPAGLYYGRVTADVAPAIADASLRGEVVLPYWRGRTSSPFPAQVAESRLREQLGEQRLDAVRLLGTAEVDGRRVVRLAHGADTWAVELEPDTLRFRPTCGSAEQPMTGWQVREIRRDGCPPG